MEERCNLFAAAGTKDPNWAFHSIDRFLEFQKERVERRKSRVLPPKHCKVHKIVLRDD